MNLWRTIGLCGFLVLSSKSLADCQSAVDQYTAYARKIVSNYEAIAEFNSNMFYGLGTFQENYAALVGQNLVLEAGYFDDLALRIEEVEVSGGMVADNGATLKNEGVRVRAEFGQCACQKPLASLDELSREMDDANHEFVTLISKEALSLRSVYRVLKSYEGQSHEFVDEDFESFNAAVTAAEPLMQIGYERAESLRGKTEHITDLLTECP